MKESEIQKHCLTWLHENNFFAWKNHVQGVRMARGRVKNPASGSSDIFAIKNGNFYCIEVKTLDGKLSDNQKIWLDLASEHGAIAIVVRSVHDLIEKMAINETLH